MDGPDRPSADLVAESSGGVSAAATTLPGRPPPWATGSVPYLESEIRALLHQRLRVLMPVVGVVFTILLGLYLSDVLLIGRRGALGWPGLSLYGVTAAAGMIGGVVLWSSPSFPLTWLRRLELGITVLAATTMAQTHYATLTYPAPEGFEDPRHVGLYLGAANVTSVFAWFVAIVAYGMFIPNTWRRAALVVLGLAGTALAAILAASLTEPTVAQRLPTLLLWSCCPLLIGVTAAIFGSFKISTLQQEVFAARQLGQYHLKRQLGAGGMGEVYLAEHRLLKRPCAVKLIHPQRASDPHLLQRFEREVQATAQLTHTNTVEIFDYGHTEDGTFYYVMEYLPGLSLE
ncbi:MAG: protein kinase, partial [Gemmataceae bacterium]|nr:protein kinase [Gemmataceae bacterium]